MDRFKFRAWYKPYKKMVNAGQFNGVMNKQYQGFDIMQFTGLKDKNGAEIYEGDILSFESQRKFGFQKDGVVVTLKPITFGVFHAYDSNLSEYIGFHIDERSIHHYLNYGCVVVGNIYETPDLIKK